jgi:hypothetical protein
MSLTIAKTGNRIATTEEQNHAYHALLSLGEKSAAEGIKRAAKWNMDTELPLVVTDFCHVGHHTVLLIPEGTHLVTREVLALHCFIIGLPGRIPPTLQLTNGKEQEILNADTGRTTTLPIYESYYCKFANLRIDAPTPSVLEVCLADKGDFFSDQLFQVECSANVDVLDIPTSLFMNGHSWALQTYGEANYGTRSKGERALDAFHEGGIKVIDGIFKPLVAMGMKIDALMGWK